MRSYQNMAVWQKSMNLVIEVYRLIEKLPKDEMFVLSSQIRRSAVSIPSNIAEGHGRNSDKDYIRFLNIARGSKNELETQLLICAQLGYVDNTDISASLSLCDEIDKMINALISRIK